MISSNTTERLPDKFNVLEFSLSVGCRLNCKYCPQEKFIDAYTKRFGNQCLSMDFEDFKNCLTKIQPGGGISFSGMVEPFHNKHCAEMISYAYAKGFKVSLFTTLTDMTEEDFNRIQTVKFSDLVLHIPDAENHSHFIIDDAYLSMLQRFSTVMDISYYSCHGHVHPRVQNILRKDLPIADKMRYRAGNLDLTGLEATRITGPIACQSGTAVKEYGYTPVVLPNGALVLCCNDYNLDHILGNVFKQEAYEIFGSDAYKKVERGMEDDSIDLLCRKCHSAVCKSALSRTCLEEIDMRVQNAARVGSALVALAGHVQTADLARLSPQKISSLKKMLSARTLCLWGLGKLFHDNYFQCSWNCVIRPHILCDSDAKKWGRSYFGTPCVAPRELKNYDDIFVLLYLKDCRRILPTLQDLGIENYMSIYELFHLFD